MHRIAVTFSIIILFTACTMPETKIYSLSMPSDEMMNNAKTDASVNIIVHSSRYLSQPYVACRISPYQMEISRYSKWDSSPVEIVKEAFKNSLSSKYKEVRASNFTSSGFYSVDINLKKFERSDSGSDSSGELLFDVSFFSPESKELFKTTISKKIKLDSKDNLSLAKGLSRALEEGIEDVRSKMIDFIKPI